MPELPLRQALDAAGEVIFMTDRDGVFTFVNREFEHLYGYSSLEVVGRCTPRILKSGQTTPEGYAMWWTRLNRGESIRANFVNRTRDGRLVEVEISTNVVRSDLQEIIGFLAVQRDVTLQGQADAALRRSEERYRALAETANDAIFIVDRDNRFEYLNSTAVRRLGGANQPIIGRSFQECFGPEEGPRLERAIERARNSSAPTYEEQRIAFAGGDRWIGTWLQAIGSAERLSGSVMGIARDITKQRELAERLESQNLLLNSVISASPVGILLFNPKNWTCDIANPAVGSLGAIGLTAGVPLAEGWPDAAAQLRPILDQALQSESLVQTDIELPGSRHVTVIASRDQLPQRGPSVLVMLTEVTERIRLQEQLLQAQKMEAIGRLAGGIAHDFNNLLTPILGYSELLLRTFDAGDQRREDVEEVCRAAKSAGALTRQLLTFSRKQITEPVILNLNSVMDDLGKLLRRSIGEDIELMHHHDPGLGFIRADRNQLEQVVMNLSVNARDAMPHGGVLTIATANRTLTESGAGLRSRIPPGDYVLLSIGDVGTGITPDVMLHLFEPFFTTKAFGQGTGLGLSTVYGIVAECGGYIAVATAPGEGTVFSIFLPRVYVDVTPDVESGARRVEEPPTGHETVLVVEDDDALGHLAERLLTGLGYETLLASSAEEARRISADRREPIHLVLTDVVMPGEGGVILSHRFAVEHPGTRILFMSGYSIRDLIERDAQPPGQHFLQKPFTRVTLAHAVRQALDHDLADTRRPVASAGGEVAWM